MLKLNLAIFAAVILSGLSSAAAPLAPSLKPPVVYASSVVNAEDAAIFHESLQAGDRREWSALAALAASAQDPAVSDFVLWRLATGGQTLAGFDALETALSRLEGWPRMNAVRASAEEAMRDSALSPAERIAWFEKYGEALSAEGELVYANALSATSQPAKALDVARKAWRARVLKPETERELLSRYGDQFKSKDHEARADFLLWGGSNYTGAAQRLKPKLSASYRALVDARVALISRRGTAIDQKISAVPDSLQNDPGLLFNRAQWRRKRAGNQSGATELLVQIDGADVPPNGRDNLWDERNIAIRIALKNKEYETAYKLAAPHGMSSGSDFADAEWSAGWIALRMLDEPERAIGHFIRLREGVGSPISLSRANYWLGRAYEAANNPERAQEAYKAAAVHNFAYYGQLAAERIDETLFVLPQTVLAETAEREAFRNRSLIKALRLLGEANEKGLFRQFAYHIGDQLETPAEQILLSEIGSDYQIPDIGVRGGKAGLGRGIIAPEAAYPVVSFPLQRTVSVENALVLALSRQESELNPRAISHANARGLMQMLPSTAKAQARREGLPYRDSWLTDDPGYNMTLGAAHLDDLLDQFNGSYIMTAAAYNAGASRPKKWVTEYGDPRLGEIDPVDWVELIPFSETRNYVQRVLENVQVYRQRLSAGEATRIALSADLDRGRLR